MYDQTGLLLIISGPSGVGKTTLTHQLQRRLDAQLSISVTTRPQTAKDIPGQDYYFLTEEEFVARRDQDQLLEWANVFGNYYGTPRQPVQDAIAQGKLVLLEIDVQGAIQVKKKKPDAYGIFILPPDEQILLQRLRNRQREDEQTIQKRFQKARQEIQLARECGMYDLFLVNDDLEQTVASAIKAIQTRQQTGP